MKILPLSPQLIARLLSELNAASKKIVWQVTTTPTSHSHLETNLIFKNFGTTWKFLNDVKDYSHELKHHPTITTTYNKVNLVITTHDTGNNLTDLDFKLAGAIASSSNLDGLKIKNLKPSKLSKIFNDVKYEAYEVEYLEELSISRLRKYGIARILSSNSIIVSESLAENVLDPFNLSFDGIFKKRKPGLLNDFYEVSYQDMATSTSYSPWKPIDDCVSTERSNGPVTVTRGWSTSIGTGVTTALKLATVFGITPSFSTDYFGVAGVSGAITCTAQLGKKLQFVVRNQIFNISGIKKRKVNIKDLTGRWGQVVSELDYSDEDWEAEPMYSIINSRNFQTYCITDPKYQTC